MAKKKKDKKAKADDDKPKKKAKAREVEEEVEEEYSPEAAGRPRLDIYVGLSALTSLALVGAAVFFYLDVDAAKGKQPPTVQLTLGGLKAGAAAPVPPQPRPPQPQPQPAPNP